MIYYYIVNRAPTNDGEIRYNTGNFACCGRNFNNREQFLEQIRQWKSINGHLEVNEIPLSCVQKIYGSADWHGEKRWVPGLKPGEYAIIIADKLAKRQAIIRQSIEEIERRNRGVVGRIG